MPLSDDFSLSVTANSFSMPYFFFRVQFEQIFLKVDSSKLVVQHQPHAALGPENLLATTNNPHLSHSNINYRIKRPPSMGNFFIVRDRDHRYDVFGNYIDFSKLQPMSHGHQFSQEDVDNRVIYYNLKASSYANVQDYTDLIADTGGTEAKDVRLWIEFLPQKSDVTFINNGLKDVIEGDQRIIDRYTLFIQTEKFKSFEFTVISEPRFGVLNLVDPATSAVVSSKVRSFSTQDIKDNRLYYHHDDSEHDADSFTFTAVPAVNRGGSSDNIPEFTGTFEIKMMMRNDEPPVRLVDKVFHVVRNDERLLTVDDLAFMDPDINYDPANLLYTRRRISNGQFISVRNRSQVYQFHQRDLSNREIIFKHYGEDEGRADIDVTDGQFYTNCVLQIMAGSPYLVVQNNTGVRVRHGRNVVISTKNLSIETNLNVRDYDIHFVLLEEPHFGHIKVAGKNVNEFVYEDLSLNKVTYQHDGDMKHDDSFQFTVVARNIQLEGVVHIKVIMEASQEPPGVVNNRGLQVYIGSKRNVIQTKHLLVEQAQYDPRDIEYLILVSPKHGNLLVDNVRLDSEDEMTFTQADINTGRVMYEPTVDNASHDQFIFEVSNGIADLRGLEFMIDIMPYSLTFQVQNMSVIEGGKKTLTSQHLQVDKKFSNRQDIVFTIRDQPNFGRLELDSDKGKPLSSFTLGQVQRGMVAYIHDNSESQQDHFSLSMQEGQDTQDTEAQIVYVDIEGINDEAPMIVTNTGLKTWKGSMTQLTADILSVRDPDSPASDLVYRISTPTNGYISLLNNTLKGISTFRQSWIDDHLLVYVHKGNTFHVE